jgi:hypothetical protein
MSAYRPQASVVACLSIALASLSCASARPLRHSPALNEAGGGPIVGDNCVGARVVIRQLCPLDEPAADDDQSFPRFLTGRSPELRPMPCQPRGVGARAGMSGRVEADHRGRVVRVSLLANVPGACARACIAALPLSLRPVRVGGVPTAGVADVVCDWPGSRSDGGLTMR